MSFIRLSENIGVQLFTDTTMATLIERLAVQAYKTFSRRTPLTPQSFQTNFSNLKSLADQLTAEDINLHESLANYDKKKTSSKNEAPVTYIEIFENEDVTIGIFVLKPNARIPLHDHPSMHGLLKVILGSVKVQSYTILSNENQDRTPDCLRNGIGGSGDIFSRSLKKQAIVIADKLPEAVYSSSSGACVLSPSDKNLHDIRSVDGTAAFLDILAPPYNSDNSNDDARVCHYFTEAPKPPSVSGEENKHSDNHIWLLQIPSPREFWCDTEAYLGPEINLL